MKWSMMFLIACVAATSSGCLPVVNTYQTARLARPGQLETTAGLAYVRAEYGEEGDATSELQFTGQVNYGVSEGVEVRGMIGHQGWGAVPVVAAVKFSLIEDHLAFDLPVGLDVQDLVEATPEGSARPWSDRLKFLSIHPALIGTYRFNSNVEATTSVRTSAFLGRVDEGLVSTGTLGLGLSTDLESWAVRPEFGAGVVGLGRSPFFSVGLGLAGRFGG